MIYRETEVPEALRSVALCAWQFILEEGDPPSFQHQVPPDATTNLVVIRPPDGSVLRRIVGPTLAAFAVPITAGFRFAGLRLRPEAALALTGRPPQVGWSDFVPPDGHPAAIWADLIALTDGDDGWRQSTSADWPADGSDPLVAGAVDALIMSGGAVSMTELVAAAGLSARQFRRRFHAATGVAPKQYADVQRARRALVLALDSRDWAGVAHDSGFADQPHLVRDIRDRFGAAPRRVAGYLGSIRHELLPHGGVRFVQDQAARAA